MVSLIKSNFYQQRDLGFKNCFKEISDFIKINYNILYKRFKRFLNLI